MFGLTNTEGNHGEDVKEYYFHLDSTPTHSYMKYLYKYPQRAYPYEDLVTVNQARERHDPEYELLDTDVFDENRYFDVFVEYAKAGPEDLLIEITAHNRGPDEASPWATFRARPWPPSARATGGRLTCTGWPDNDTHHNLLAWSWTAGHERYLVVINYSDRPAQGRVPLPWTDFHGQSCKLAELLAGNTYEREGDELVDPGLFRLTRRLALAPALAPPVGDGWPLRLGRRGHPLPHDACRVLAGFSESAVAWTSSVVR